MPGSRLTNEDKRRFFHLVVEAGMSPEQAARELGFSKATGYRLMRGVKQSPVVDARRSQRDLPEPKSYDQLDGGVKDLLRPEGFNDFGVVFFCRRPAAWRLEAAGLVVDYLTSPDQVFLDMNVFPGSGKTTLWHDIEAWLLCGGGSEDPAYGRALRMMLGAYTLKVAKHSVGRLRRSLELTRPHFDKEQNRTAELVLAREFGRFKPDVSVGEESLWAQDQFLVAQFGDVDLYEKEPTVQAASQESGFLGERVDLAVWDDLAVSANSRNIEVAETTDKWFEDEGESRVEPEGLLALVGQRLGPLDLHRKRLDATYTDDDGVVQPLYEHIIFPAHWDELCDGKHRQWNGVRPGKEGEPDGCLTDEYRMSWRKVLKLSARGNFQTVYQQKDADPGKVLVQPVWLEGGEDSEGYPAPGCFDRDRGFFEHPEKVGRLVDYASVDPAAGHWWALEWWATQLDPVDGKRYRYLIYGERRQMQAGAFLDWDNEKQDFTGIMHEMQVASIVGGHPIRVWVVEHNAAHKYLSQFEHFRRWRQRFPMVQVIKHTTGANKADPERGVEASLQMLYRQGLKRLPRRQGDIRSLNYMAQKIKELTNYPDSTTDTVMADWFPEWNMPAILMIARRGLSTEDPRVEAKLPRYLERQFETVNYGTEE